jgi:hypothetical protein
MGAGGVDICEARTAADAGFVVGLPEGARLTPAGDVRRETGTSRFVTRAMK